MPDLPELYERLDAALRAMEDMKTDTSMAVGAAVVSALCAAIEVKQTQELHDMLNKPKVRPILENLGETDIEGAIGEWKREQSQELHEVLNESALESACKLVIDVGLATGHADTWEELVEEVKSQFDEKNTTATWSRASTPEEMWDKMDEEGETTTETQEEA